MFKSSNSERILENKNLFLLFKFSTLCTRLLKHYNKLLPSVNYDFKSKEPHQPACPANTSQRINL